MEDEEGGDGAAEQQAGGEEEPGAAAQRADLAVVELFDLFGRGEAGVQLQAERRVVARLRSRGVEEFSYLVFHFSRYVLMCCRPRVR